MALKPPCDPLEDFMEVTGLRQPHRDILAGHRCGALCRFLNFLRSSIRWQWVIQPRVGTTKFILAYKYIPSTISQTQRTGMYT